MSEEMLLEPPYDDDNGGNAITPNVQHHLRRIMLLYVLPAYLLLAGIAVGYGLYMTHSRNDATKSLSEVHATVGAQGTLIDKLSATIDQARDQGAQVQTPEQVAAQVPGANVSPVGPAGERGDAGPAGPTGPPGDVGPQGDTGPQGETGATGPTPSEADIIAAVRTVCGDSTSCQPTRDQIVEAVSACYASGQCPVVPGPVGATGTAGPQGVTGDQGPQGDPGPPGAVGDAGPAGPQGSQGQQGTQGDTGAQGPQGETGAQGPGPTDAQIQAQVNAYFAANPAATGPAGPPGPAGVDGTNGTNGTNGVDGKTPNQMTCTRSAPLSPNFTCTVTGFA